jgi:Tfp pilus assembly protein PilP
MAMKLTTGIVTMAMMVGGVWAQNPNIIDKTRSTMNSVQEQKTADSNAALAGVGQTGKPAPGAPAIKPAPAPAVKPANAPVSKPVPAIVTPVKAAPTAKAVSPVKAVVKATPAPAPKAKPVAEKAASPLSTASSTAKPQVVAPKPTLTAKAPPKIAAKEPVQTPKQQAAKQMQPSTPAPGKPAADASKKGDVPKQPKAEDKKWSMTGKRDPFFSPVVQQAGGSGCSTGKKCLEIGQINLRGVVKSDNGFIAVVTNNMNKAYFLRENDPVFNGYVVKITGDSVVFQETMQDKLGKQFTREIVKRIFTPAV